MLMKNKGMYFILRCKNTGTLILAIKVVELCNTYKIVLLSKNVIKMAKDQECGDLCTWSMLDCHPDEG